MCIRDRYQRRVHGSVPSCFCISRLRCYSVGDASGQKKSQVRKVGIKLKITEGQMKRNEKVGKLYKEKHQLKEEEIKVIKEINIKKRGTKELRSKESCLLYTSPSPRDQA
eukprot:TRINITY_DN6378_c0_g1_i1.p2 TRINITY_DN6378_c0_g1~~TRINITY_DN6378_c0_g1_i1.p2  ORF type:complete len:110 (-),score=16.54 TRINITY_DN6378_c0_g1_i1:107-436(-)